MAHGHHEPECQRTCCSWHRRGMHTPMVPSRRVASLAGLLGGAGVTHFVRPALFEGLIPRRLRRVATPRTWVLASGAAELACAATVATPATRRLGATASAGLFVAVFPGNLTMALDYRRLRKPAWQQALALARLPLQWPLVTLALRVRDSAATQPNSP